MSDDEVLYRRCRYCHGKGSEFRNSPSYGWHHERCDHCRGNGYTAVVLTKAQLEAMLEAVS